MIELIGTKDLIRNLDKVKEQYLDRAEQALNNSANAVKRDSVDIAPIDTGLLRKTAKNTKTGKLERTISYDTPYAVRMHEHPEYNFQEPGQGKYLEQPVMQYKGRMLKDLQRDIKI